MPPKPTGTYGRPAPHDALRRQANFGRKVVPAHVGSLVTALKPGMSRNVGDALSSLSRLYSAVEAVVNTDHAPDNHLNVFEGAQYHNFARECWAIKRSHRGAVAYVALVNCAQDWESRGLYHGILYRILDEVFGLVLV